MGQYSSIRFPRTELGPPTRVESSSTKRFEESYPVATMVHFDFAARAGMPPVRVNWYDADLTPPRPEGLPDDQPMGFEREGLLFVGDHGSDSLQIRRRRSATAACVQDRRLRTSRRKRCRARPGTIANSSMPAKAGRSLMRTSSLNPKWRRRSCWATFRCEPEKWCAGIAQPEGHEQCHCAGVDCAVISWQLGLAISLQPGRRRGRTREE